MAELEPGSLPARRDPRSLMSRPQRLGVLPTLWFWREVRTERPAIGILTGFAMGVFSVAVGALLRWSGLALPFAFILAMCVPLLALGIIEYGLRRLVIKRRRLLAGSDRETLAALGGSARRNEQSRHARPARTPP